MAIILASIGKFYTMPGGLKLFAATPMWSYYFYVKH
jgi:hypothetical protein